MTMSFPDAMSLTPLPRRNEPEPRDVNSCKRQVTSQTRYLQVKVTSIMHILLHTCTKCGPDRTCSGRPTSVYFNHNHTQKDTAAADFRQLQDVYSCYCWAQVRTVRACTVVLERTTLYMYMYTVRNNEQALQFGE